MIGCRALSLNGVALNGVAVISSLVGGLEMEGSRE
jgi:hypothetical protein